MGTKGFDPGEALRRHFAAELAEERARETMTREGGARRPPAPGRVGSTGSSAPRRKRVAVVPRLEFGLAALLALSCAAGLMTLSPSSPAFLRPREIGLGSVERLARELGAAIDAAALEFGSEAPTGADRSRSRFD